MERLVPKYVVVIRSFMGLARYYRHFVEGFSIVAYPITSLQKKGEASRWTPEFHKSFDQLKHLLTTAPILSIDDRNKEYVVYTAASKEGVGSVLMQEGRAVAYESRKLKEYEQKYSAYDLELKVVIYVVMKPDHKKIAKIDQRLRIQPLRGGNLLYITQMNKSFMIQMKKPPFYVQESKGSQYNQANLTIII